MDDYRTLIGREVYGQEGEKIGTIDRLYVGEQSREPVFATVKTGLFSGSSFVPLAEAQMDGERIAVPYTKDQVKDAPNIEADQELEPDEENRLYEHYSIERGDSRGEGDSDNNKSDDTAADQRDSDEPYQSDEQSEPGGRPRETSHYRLREYVVTDVITRTIPVEHKDVQKDHVHDHDHDRDDNNNNNDNDNDNV